MKIEAFGSLPLLKIFFNSSTHNSTWHYLLYGIASSEPFLMVSGDYGMGKTTLCLGLIRLLEKKGETDFVYISTPNYGYAGILADIAAKLGIEQPHAEESRLQNQIYQHFRAMEKPESFLLILDDAQDLDIKTLEKLRALSNFNHNGVFPFRFIFFAHSSFLEKLQEPTLIPLNQRIKRRSHLEHFEYNEVKEYIFSRLVKSGAPGIPTFSEDALGLVFTNSQGIPRLINNLCDACLLIAATRRQIEITAAIVREAIASISEAITQKSDDDRFVLSQPQDAVAEVAEEKVPEEEYFEDEDSGYDDDYDDGYEDRSGGHLNLNMGGPVASTQTVLVTPKKRNRLWLIILVIVVLLLLVGLTYYAIDLYWKRSFDEAKGKSPFENEQTYTPPQKEAESQPPEKYRRDDQSENTSKYAEPSQWSQKEINKRLDRSATWDKIAENPNVPARQSYQQPYSNATDQMGSKSELESGRMLAPQGNPQPIIHETTLWPYSIHLSSYRHLDQAKEEFNDYVSRGLNPFMVRVSLPGKGNWWRIYVGNYRTMKDAQQAQSRYHLAGASVQNTPFANFIGDYASDADMAVTYQRLKKQGYFPYATVGAGNMQKLYVGAFADRQSAETHNQRLIADGNMSRVIRR